ncbi:B12-binding domain-containing radical SAM protein [Candidatus Entotheonella palauensis]|uniref:Radical SAM protein n=1 Tax=Candidatus Entotheonella gemina TaxID=1429439 RepID=W4M0X2_9BACT|nr:radical SAM protein [Candidatus Entotheonella palauensis]ETX03825.1 MAG: radical SAM protein [Candidatus Entotheonella gemina]
MTDLLLTHGYFLFEDEKELEIMKPYPPLGLLYVSAYLRRNGFSVDFFDTTFAKREELVGKLQAESGVVGIYTNLMTRKPILDIIRIAKDNGWTVVLGGPESANYPDEYLRRGADVVVAGEGEVTLSELLPALAERGAHRLHGVAGTVFRDEFGQIVHNPEREQIADIDSIPWPDREQIDLQRYIDVWREHHGMGSVNLITARGCPYKCRWCSHAVFGYTHRRRNYLDCANEVEHIKDTYKPDQVWYADDVFTIHRTWLLNYAAELKRRHIKLPFETISRADRMMREDILETLAEMGCYRIWIGSESGSQRILDAMERGVTVEQVEWATKAAQRHGIQVGMFLMWGYDGEEIEDIEATIEHVKRCNPDIFFTTVSYPIMNTTYYKTVADRVILPSDWADSTDRDYVIAGRHSRQYYKYADQWLRNEVAAFRLESEDAAAATLKRQEAQQAQNAMLGVAAEVEA